MAIRTTYKYKCDLDKGTLETSLRNSLMQADALADAFAVTVQRNGADVDISGMTAYGYLYANATKTTVPLKGAVSGSTATVILSEDCYAVPGYASLMIQLHDGDVRHTMLKVDFVVTRTGGTLVLDGENVLPSLAELLGKIAEMEAVTADGEATIATIKADTAAAIKATNEATAATQTATVELAKTAAPAITPTVSGSIVSITDGAERPAVSLISHIEPVQEGEGDPSPDNVRPIRGWDEVVVRRTGKNLAQPILTKKTPKTYKGITYCRNADDSVSLEGTATAAVFLHICNASVKEGVAYKMKGISGASATTYQLYTDSEFIELYPGDSVNSATAVKDGVTAIRFAVYEGITIDMTIYPQLEIGDNVTAYEPYEGQTLTAELPETIYAGILDWNTGILTKYNRVVYDGVTAGLMMTGTDPNANVINYPYAYVHVYQEKFGDFILACNKLPIVPNNSNYEGEAVMGDRAIAVKLSRERIGWEESDTTTDIVAKINAVLNQWYLDGEPLEVVYIPSNPETVQLTPQQLETLKGYNNVWSDTGDTDLVYVADTKMYIDNKLTAIAAATLEG